MTIKVPAEEPSRRRRASPSSYHYHPVPLLPSLLLAVAALLLNNNTTGRRSASSFLLSVRSSPIIRASSAMSTGNDNCATSVTTSKINILRAEEEGDVVGDGISRGASPPNDDGGDSSPEEEEEERVLQLLPEATDDPSIPTIKLGESITFEEMGPVIINSDGTTRRIDNWDQMTKGEQEVAWRRIAKRNEERRKVLLERLQEQQKESEEGKEGSD